MKIETNCPPDGHTKLTEVFAGIILETEEGNRVGLCMRDDTIEFNVIPATGPSRWFRINMQTATVEPMITKLRDGIFTVFTSKED